MTSKQQGLQKSRIDKFLKRVSNCEKVGTITLARQNKFIFYKQKKITKKLKMIAENCKQIWNCLKQAISYMKHIKGVGYFVDLCHWLTLPKILTERCNGEFDCEGGSDEWNCPCLGDLVECACRNITEANPFLDTQYAVCNNSVTSCHQENGKSRRWSLEWCPQFYLKYMVLTKLTATLNLLTMQTIWKIVTSLLQFQSLN